MDVRVEKLCYILYIESPILEIPGGKGIRTVKVLPIEYDQWTETPFGRSIKSSPI